MKVSKETYQFFCERVKYWANMLGVKDWKICFSQLGYPDIPHQAYAHVTIKVQERIVLISMCQEFPSNLSEGEDEPDRHAFHEACHLMLADLESYAAGAMGDTPKGILDTAVHGIVRRLENLFEDRFVKMPIESKLVQEEPAPKWGW